MAEGFLKGLWGKPAVSGTGLMGLWGTVTKVPKRIIGAVTTPFKLIAYIGIIVVGLLLYRRINK